MAFDSFLSQTKPFDINFSNTVATKLKGPAGTLVNHFTTLLLEHKQSNRFSPSTLNKALGSNPFVLEYLLGIRDLPSTPGSRYIRSQSSLSAAHFYAHTFLRHWKEAEGALDAIKPYCIRGLAVWATHQFAFGRPESYLDVERFSAIMSRLKKCDDVNWNDLVLRTTSLVPVDESHHVIRMRALWLSWLPSSVDRYLERLSGC
jgi:hypothetical protein